MGQLLNKQSDRNPIASTHLDQWIEVPYDFNYDDDEWDGLGAFQEADLYELAPMLDSVVEDWSNILGIPLHPQRVSEINYGSWLNMMLAIGFDGTMKIILFEILRHEDYDVYSGDEFIEIYKVEHDLFVGG